MTMNKMFAGLIAFVAGVALSAGSAFATNGYVGGDHARVKLVPYFETGDSKATIIGIQNTSPQQASTIALNTDVTDIQAVLAGEAATANAAGLIDGIDAAGGSLCADAAACTPGQAQDPTKKANAEAALEKAKMAAHVEHLFVMVNAYDDMGMMMGSATLCLGENQFGVVVLQGPMDMMEMDGTQMHVLSYMDEEIPAYGSVRVMAEDRKFTGCGATAPNTLQRVDNDDDASTPLAATDSKIAVWTIIQDVGDGFFGTEVPTSTLMTTAAMDNTATANVNEAEQLDCYDATAGTADDNDVPRVGVAFTMTDCGLVPERHNNTRDATSGAPTAGTTTPRASITARYDVGDETMVYVWLAEGMDMETTLPKDSRKIEVAVKCEDGMMPMGPDTDGDNKPDPVMVAAPGMLTMIDPSMGAVGALTDMCMGDRGVLEIKMPDGSYAGTAFTHITQMMGHYRMNFPGYSMASPTGCVENENCE